MCPRVPFVFIYYPAKVCRKTESKPSILFFPTISFVFCILLDFSFLFDILFLMGRICAPTVSTAVSLIEAMHHTEDPCHRWEELQGGC